MKLTSFNVSWSGNQKKISHGLQRLQTRMRKWRHETVWRSAARWLLNVNQRQIRGRKINHNLPGAALVPSVRRNLAQ